ncbi:MAG: hypothetical protein GF350_03985 [Chitinivibrionales bacterium]|nr:hypothetical protein [Chitinivibrionales bacterium]
MKTLFLGAYGFGNLGDELCLIDAMQRFPSSESYVRSIDPGFTGRFVHCSGFVNWKPSRPGKKFKLDFERVVVGGGGLFYKDSADDFLAYLIAAQNSGCRTCLYNVGVAPGRIGEWLDERALGALNRLDLLAVRDTFSAWILHDNGVVRNISVTNFPETGIAPDNEVAEKIYPDEKILGISMSNNTGFLQKLERERTAVEKILQDFKGHKVLPIISTIHRSCKAWDDRIGFKKFYSIFLRDFDIVLPETLDRQWWRENMTPQKLKGIIGRCSFLLSRRKHNCLHAVSMGVPTIGISDTSNNNLLRLFTSLHSRLAPGSGVILI